MWKKILKSFDMKSNDNNDISRRRFPRRAMDTCAISVNGTTYPIKDWSQTGALFQADGRQFTNNTTMDVTMKFRMVDRIIEIPVHARTIRCGTTQVAIEFLDVTHEIKSALQQSD